VFFIHDLIGIWKEDADIILNRYDNNSMAVVASHGRVSECGRLIL
jgi:hypothetical protein